MDRFLNEGYEPRSYRASMGNGRLRPYTLEIGETDLWIGIDNAHAKDLDAQAFCLKVARYVRTLRNQIMACIEQYPQFATSFVPLKDINTTSSVVQQMLAAAVHANVGPMAAVAGAIAQHVGKYIKDQYHPDEVVVENGGDLYIDIASDLVVEIVAPTSPFSQRVGLVVPFHLSPLGLCTSSGRVGHSTSLGNADAAVVACSDAAFADALATATGNKVKQPSDAQLVARQLQDDTAVLAGAILIDDVFAVCGAMEVRPV